MRSWLRFNAFGFPLIALVAALILITVTWPSRSDNLDFREPVETVPAGGSTEIDGARWELTPITPDPAELRKSTIKGVDDHPENSRLVTYLVRVDGPVLPEEKQPLCAPAATDGTRQWNLSNLVSVLLWAQKHGYTRGCRLDDPPFVLAFLVPKDARITAVDFLFWPAPEGDAVHSESSGRVIRFETG